MNKLIIEKPVEFEWDEFNKDKNWLKHNVASRESEEVFLCKNKKIALDKVHSIQEQRYIIIGSTQSGRLFFIVFTMRGEKVRVISARDLNKTERGLISTKKHKG